ncbi:MAG: NAD(P)-dependent oxidoreductase [Oscillospiraceae bacterium]|nr:NAD(P)-dependent oxidoreductase [Oscillospiraceae bacterium]
MAWLITGGKGYVGSHLIRALPEELRADCLCPRRAELNLSSWESVKQYFETHEISRIVHLAAALDSDPKNLFESNIIAPYLLLEAARSYKVEYFLMASTNNVYGDGPEDFREDDAYHPWTGNHYGISKMYGELAVRTLLEGTDTQWAIVRIGDIYGPKQKVGALLKAVVGNILGARPQRLYGEGDRTRDYIYIDDVAEGFRFVLENKLQGVYNLATGKGTNVREIVAIAESISPCGEDTVLVPVEKEDHSRVVLNVDKLAAAGFRAPTGFAEGLKKIVEEEKQ